MSSKIKSLSIVMITFIVLLLTGCNNNAVSFEINFDSNGGSIVESVNYDGSSTITIPDNPTKEGFVFDGWYWDNGTFENPFTANSLLDTPIEDDLTVYAKWISNQYTLEYVDHDGTLIQTADYDFGADLSGVTAPTDPSREGYTFDGWDQVIPLTMPENDVLIKATYTINQYTITFDSNEGTSVESITQDYDTEVIEPTEPTRVGYTFEGWYFDEDYTQSYAFTTMPAEDVTLYAKWALANPIYNLVDENFRSKILDFFISQQLDFNHNGIIDYDELPGITWIDASDGEIVSLEGIEIFSNLETIYLSNNSIEDISPLLQVAKLKNLVIDNNYLGTSPFRLIDQDDIDNINMLKEKGVNTFNTEKEQKVDFNNELSIQENIATWRMLVVIVPEINTVDNLGTPVYYEMTDVEIEIAKEYARMSAIVMDVLLEYKVHFDVDIYISTTPYTGELIANADNIIFATQIDEVSNLLQNYDTTLLITSLPNIDNSHEHSIYHSASGYGSFDIEKNIGTSMMYLDSNLYGYVINNIPFERELIRLQNNSILSTIWLPVHEIIHTIEYYSISKGYITWEFHNAIVQYGHSIDNWMYYDIYNPYLNGSENPENNVEFGIVDEIWINPPGLEERD